MSLPIYAQSAEERKAVIDAVNAENLRRLSAEFQADFERQEALVFAYLKQHPDKPRSFEKNGSTYYLKRLGPDGSPVYINSKRSANTNPEQGGGSR